VRQEKVIGRFPHQVVDADARNGKNLKASVREKQMLYPDFWGFESQ
jgi:hypothetical protein